MISNEIHSTTSVHSLSSESLTLKSEVLTCMSETSKHVDIQIQEEKEEKGVLEIHGGSISERLAALQRSGSENWKKRLGGRPAILLPNLMQSPDTPVLRMKEKQKNERPRSLMDRIAMLSEAQDQWRNRVEDKDASQFTVSGKMVQMQYSPQASPLINRKKYSPKPIQSRSKTTNIQELSSYISHSTPASPYHLSKSQSAMITSSSSSELEKMSKVSVVQVPKIDDESFTSFFGSAKERISVSSFNISDEVFEYLSSEKHELLCQRREKLKVQRKHASSGNPLKLLASRSDLKQTYEEVYQGIAEREIERMKLEKMSLGSNLALSALAGLASTEDFKNVALKKGQVSDPSLENSISLLQIKGRRYAQVRLVEPVSMSMNHGDSYVLVTNSQVYCWHGEFSNVIERVKASEVANLIQASKDLGFKGQSEVIVIEEENNLHYDYQERFFEFLSGKHADVKTAASADEDELYEIAIVNTNAIYELSENELTPCCANVPKIDMLKANSIYVFDFGPEMYVWCGKLASAELRKTGIALARDLWDQGYNYSECDINPFNAAFGGPIKNQDSKRPWGTFVKTSQHREPVLFKEKFFDWPNIHPLISQKSYDENNKTPKVPTCISDLQSCDYKSMLEYEVDEPDTILENHHVGRGLEWHDEAERRHFRISTVSRKMWHISEQGCEVMPEESWGQFHNYDTYVVKWQYMISNTGRTLKGGVSRYSFVGRKRWAYFFWQGEKSPITEKGASALMAIELNEEKVPHVRVTCGKEPPCFLNLFQGRMVVHNGRRGVSSPEEAETDPWKLFILRGDMKTEALLHEVKLSKASLRSRTSFLLVNSKTGLVCIWHGCKSATHTRDFILNSAQLIVDNRPNEMRFQTDAKLVLKEVEEGSEPKDFWIWTSENDEPFYSLFSSDLSYDFTPRLFLIDSMSGCMRAKEISCPYFTKTHSCPFPLQQLELKKASQPAFFLLDNHHDVYVWHGWQPDDSPDSDNNVTGSAKLRWEISRKLVLETALQYCQGKNAEEIPKAFTVHAGSEPLYFTNIFPQWEEWEVKNVMEEENSKVMLAQEVLSQLSRDRYSLAELQNSPRPIGVDPLRLESYLTDQEFEELFGMEKEEFYNMPSWKQSELKKAKELF